jgi:hypothetical protein
MYRDGTFIQGPSEEELEKNRQENIEARRIFDAERAKVEAAKVAARDAEQEAALKANARLRYAGLTDADFERLWPIRLRDDELIIAASAVANRPLEAWYTRF